MSVPPLPSDTRIGAVHLRVRELERMVAFYQDTLGFSVVGDDGATAALGVTAERPLLTLHGAPDAATPPPNGTGLFHTAFRMPTRRDLAGMSRWT